MLRFLWRRFIADRLCQSLAARLVPELEARVASAVADRCALMRSEILTAVEARMAIPQPPPTPTLVSRSPTEHPTHSIIVNGKSLTFGGEPGDHYFENLPAFQGDNEQLVRILPRIPDGAIYLDIGANIGLTALTMAASLPRGQIYAFEPSLKNLPHLRNNIRANLVDNVTVVPAAVGIAGGTLAITQPPSGAHTSVIRTDAGALTDAVQVPVVSLDAWATESGIETVDFIKIDVEGYEAQVLIGAAEMLVRCRMPVLMEFNSVTISFEEQRSPWTFAQELASVFEMSVAEDDGTIRRVDGDDLRRFVLTNMTQHGCIDDVILRAEAHVTADDIRTALGSLGGPGTITRR